MPPVIAALDDEADILELLKVNLEKSGYRFEGFQEAEDLYRYLAREKPALILLDLMLPGTDGLEVCRQIRRSEDLAAIPVIMLTARGDESDKVVGLELGADDYVTKPFSVKELIARIHAVLRRPGGRGGRPADRRGDDRHRPRQVRGHGGRSEDRIDGDRIQDPALLVSRKGRVFSRDQILDHLWGSEKAVIDRTVDVHIRNLREKLGSAASLIKNIRGVGYKLEE